MALVYVIQDTYNYDDFPEDCKKSILLGVALSEETAIKFIRKFDDFIGGEQILEDEECTDENGNFKRHVVVGNPVVKGFMNHDITYGGWITVVVDEDL